jgi:transposase-like protein
MSVLSDRISAEVKRLYLSGLSVESIAKSLDVSYRTVKRALEKSGTELRDPSTRLKGRTRPKKLEPLSTDSLAKVDAP